MGRTFKSKEAQDAYWARWKQYQDTGKYPARQKPLSGAQKASEAHAAVHADEAPAHPTLFDLPPEAPKNPGYYTNH